MQLTNWTWHFTALMWNEHLCGHTFRWNQPRRNEHPCHHVLTWNQHFNLFRPELNIFSDSFVNNQDYNTMKFNKTICKTHDFWRTITTSGLKIIIFWYTCSLHQRICQCTLPGATTKMEVELNLKCTRSLLPRYSKADAIWVTIWITLTTDMIRCDLASRMFPYLAKSVTCR